VIALALGHENFVQDRHELSPSMSPVPLLVESMFQKSRI
jgi:hypothetical protein